MWAKLELGEESWSSGCLLEKHELNFFFYPTTWMVHNINGPFISWKRVELRASMSYIFRIEIKFEIKIGIALSCSSNLELFELVWSKKLTKFENSSLFEFIWKKSRSLLWSIFNISSQTQTRWIKFQALSSSTSTEPNRSRWVFLRRNKGKIKEKRKLKRKKIKERNVKNKVSLKHIGTLLLIKSRKRTLIYFVC